MSCLPEYRYAIYVDGELEGEALREVKAHLVSCRECRSLVVALEEEAALLGDVLQERVRAPLASPSGSERARGLALGLAPALGVVALIVTIGGWLLERELPAGVGWLSPLKLIGAYEMLFDTIFMLRDRAPEMFDLVIAVGVMASAAAIATFLAGALVRQLSRGLAPVVMFVVLGGLGIGEGASALQLRDDAKDIRIGADEVVEETLVASGDSVTVEGEIRGDLIVLAERFVLTGRVTGNLYGAGREVELLGEVDGAAHLVGERVLVEGSVTRNLYAGAETLTLRDGGRVGWDATFFGEDVRVNGVAGRDLLAFGDRIEIRGGVGRDATTRGGMLVVHDAARIGRDLDVRVQDEGDEEIAAGATIGGETRTGVLEHGLPHVGSRWANPHFYLRSLVFLVSAFIVGMALHMLLPGLFTADLPTSTEFFRCLGFGFVALVMSPIFLVLCLITVVGIPIGVIGFFVYVTTLFVSVIVVAALVGGALVGHASESSYGFGTSLLLGLVVVLLAANLPLIGALLRILVLLTGLGLLLTSTHATWRRGREASYA